MFSRVKINVTISRVVKTVKYTIYYMYIGPCFGRTNNNPVAASEIHNSGASKEPTTKI